MLIELPDGGHIDIPIEHMIVKDSIFIPTLEAGKAKKLINKVSDELEIQTKCKQVVYNGYLGVIIWRVA
jgi:hypothetical protein